MEYFPKSENYFSPSVEENNNDLDREDVCNICYLKNNDKSIKLTCKHSFHLDCLKMNLEIKMKNKYKTGETYSKSAVCPYCNARDTYFNNFLDTELNEYQKDIKKQRQAPNLKSKNCNVGYIHISENDNHKYIIYELSLIHI